MTPPFPPGDVPNCRCVAIAPVVYALEFTEEEIFVLERVLNNRCRWYEARKVRVGGGHAPPSTRSAYNTVHEIAEAIRTVREANKLERERLRAEDARAAEQERADARLDEEKRKP